MQQARFSPVDNSLLHFEGTFVEHCEGAAPALTGTLDYDAAPVVTPPVGVSHLSAVRSGTGLAISWVNPAFSGYRYTVVRMESGYPVAKAPTAGRAVYTGHGTQATAFGLQAGEHYEITAFTVDQYGNVSGPSSIGVTG